MKNSTSIPYEQLKRSQILCSYLLANNEYLHWHLCKTAKLVKISALFHLSPSHMNRQRYLTRSCKHIIQWFAKLSHATKEQMEEIDKLDLKNTDIPLFEVQQETHHNLLQHQHQPTWRPTSRRNLPHHHKQVFIPTTTTGQ